MRPIPTEPMLENCVTCAKETRHEPDTTGTYVCTVCRDNARRARTKKQGNQMLLIVIGGIVLILGGGLAVQKCAAAKVDSMEGR